MASMKMMHLFFGLVTVASAAPQFAPSRFGSSGLSSFNNHGSNNSSSGEDSIDSSADTVTSSYGASANVSSSSIGGISLHALIYGRPTFTDDVDPSSSSFSFGGSSPFSSDAGVSASESASFGDSSNQSSSASAVHFSRSHPSIISGADAASPAPVSTSLVSSSVASGSSSGFSSGAAFHSNVSQASGAAKTSKKTDESSDVATEASSSGSTFKFGSSGDNNTHQTTFL